MALDTPASLRASSIYQVFVRNWSAEGGFDAALPSIDVAKRLGFDIIYLTPIHPVGAVARKGAMGSPYAIADYRKVDPVLGGEEAFRRYLDAAHRAGLRVIIDVVFNHTSPDSLLAREHPEWFVKGADGKPGPRVADWSDVVDLDYSHRGLRDYLLESLEGWVRFGVDGFRCDVASMVPVDFWAEARRRCAAARVARERPAGAVRERPAGAPEGQLLWLAESVHKEFVDELRARGIAAACDAELHEAFDLSYDYDGREELEEAWAGRAPLSAYLHHLSLQRCMYPAHAIKARFLENHDQVRAASRFQGAALRNWTLFAMLLEGSFLAYAGQEVAIAEKPSLFDKDTVPWERGDADFGRWFAAAHAATKAIRARETRFALGEPAEGLVLIERSGGGHPVAALLNLRGLSGRVDLPRAMAGRDLLTGERVELAGRAAIPTEPILIELGVSRV
ncbi:MAG TPA: alpha-amylase family glycosyl hydrolase [Rectinemataceae bacterium]|nr:alpha-amylase family glycosyl hydrolase [Rectinemataceae bacterium]